MRKIHTIAAFLAFLPFVSCVEPEVIPAPTPQLNMKEHFIGTINGSQIEWTKNVNGYRIRPENDFLLDTVNYDFGWRFYTGMGSETDPKTVKIGIGALEHDPNVQADPSIESFKNFVMQFADPATAPPFSTNAAAGFEVQYRDASGELLKSVETNPGTYAFSNIQYKEDQNGEYMTFVCDFSATVFSFRRDTATNMDTIYKQAEITNARLSGYFRRTK